MPSFEEIKARLNIRDVIRSEIPGGLVMEARARDTYHCPFHDDKTPSFSVTDDFFKCFGCDTKGDVIKFIERWKEMKAVDAARYLTERYLHEQWETQRQAQMPRRQLATPPRNVPSEPPSNEWQKSARKIMVEAGETLWSERGKRARDYLKARGLYESTIEDQMLGYVPGHYTEWREMHGLKVPCGIIIPWRGAGALWGLKVRRATGQPKYVQVGGGNVKGALYNVDAIAPGETVIVTEGEFDALIASQLGFMLATGVGLGSASNHQISQRWQRNLAVSPRIIALMDDDPAGRQAANELSKFSAAVRLATVPAPYGDLSDFAIASEHAAMAWLEDVIRDEQAQEHKAS